MCSSDLKCADNLVVINGGAIEVQGAPEDVLTEQLIAKVFGVKSSITRHPISQTPLVIT